MGPGRPDPIQKWRERRPGLEPVLKRIWVGEGTAEDSQVLSAYVDHAVAHAPLVTIQAFMYDVMVPSPPPWSTTGPQPGQDSEL